MQKPYIDTINLSVSCIPKLHMTKLYEKLTKAAPSGCEIATALEKISKASTGGPGRKDLMSILNMIDLTSLSVTDNRSSIIRLTGKVNSFAGLFGNIPNVAAICVYPNFVPIVREKLIVRNVKIAAVAGGFPTSQTFKSIKIAEAKMAVDAGADEIDIVISVGSFLANDHKKVADEIREIKDAIGDKQLKIIIESGILAEPASIFHASMIAMDAGADFIKTSTGKSPVSATPEAAYIMCRAIADFYSETGIRVGFKAAGGIVTSNDAYTYYNIVSECLGDDWLNNQHFRIGASRLANNLLSEISGESCNHF